MELIRRHKLVAIAILAVVYMLTGRLALHMTLVHPSATAIWPLAGISLAALLIFGYELWPGILIGSFLANLTMSGSLLVCLSIAGGNTLEALAAAWLVNRFCGGTVSDGGPALGRLAVYRTQGILQFSLLTGLLSSTIAATVGALSLVLGGNLPRQAFGTLWVSWWLGCGVSNIVIAPALILWITHPRVRWRQSQFFEAAALLGSLIFAGMVIFDGVFDIAMEGYPLEYMCIPFLLWAAYRFGPREASAATLVLAATAVWGTAVGFGPFARASESESALLLQTFIGVVGVMTMCFATAFAERRSAEMQTRLLAVSDPLTGLGNYRKLIDTIDAEIRRSSRTGRPFAMLLLDLDSLKKINDAHGHLTGSRALCRLADILRLHSRSMDTAARYGGDEFALILPEAGASAARHISERIAARTAAQNEAPRLSVSIGTAIYPEDGTTVEALLNAADLALYESKRRGRQTHESAPSTRRS